MMLLIGLAITVAFVSSWGASLGVLRPPARLLVGAGAADRHHAARPLDRDAVAGADQLGARLAGRAAARRGRTGRGTTTSSRSPRRICGVGDVVIVRPGGSVPADGEIVDGAARHQRVDGHRRVPAGAPRRRRPRRRGHRRNRFRVCASGSPPSATTPRWPASSGWSTEAQNSSSRAQRLADIAPRAGCSGSRWAPRVITAVVWGFVGKPEEAVIRTITVLVIACPHALGLAIPLVVSIATERAARGGRAGQGPARAGKHAHGRRRPVRQDRHPDQG